MSVKALKAIAEGKGVSLAGCVEKGDIIRAVRGPVRRDAESRDRQLLRLERTAEQRLESSWTAIAPPAACRVLRFRTFGDRGLVAVTFDAPATTTVADALRAYASRRAPGGYASIGGFLAFDGDGAPLSVHGDVNGAPLSVHGGGAGLSSTLEGLGFFAGEIVTVVDVGGARVKMVEDTVGGGGGAAPASSCVSSAS
mmetsp:Transcript_21987/g.65930  ORF Transcript_21987/g.65930 Transcript_21987/m.65930 type:complete len:197 (-) Transcript_21987:1731-2321(-)